MLSTAVVLAASMVVGQAEQDFEKHDKLDQACGWLIGDWEGTNTDGVQITWEVKWGLNGQCIIGEIEGKNPGSDDVLTGLMSMFWCDKSDKAKYVLVVSNGMNAQGTLIESAKNTATWKRSGMGGQGQTEGKMVFRLSDDVLVFELTDVKTLDGTPAEGFTTTVERQQK